ncbi:prenyltransferase/squalene oxidase repeat-containing protein, partial [Chloroflexota bacterium]
MKHKIVTIVVALVLLFGMIAAPVQAVTTTQIDTAIKDGLAWLATQQNANGSFGSGANPVAYTAAAVLAFENEGYFPGPDSSTPSPAGTYERRVEDGLNFIFNYARIVTVSNQTHGPRPGDPLGTTYTDNPDTDGDGKGVCFYDESRNREVYETGMVMQAIVASNRQGRQVTTGPCAGWTYYDVMVDVVDWAAFGQADSGWARGGWHYYANQGTADNSTAQWPVLGLIAAEQWGIQAPQFVKDELEIWIVYIQNPNGGSGYSNNNQYVNVSKTGGLLVEMYYVGWDASHPRAVNAINFINSKWNGVPSGTWYGNKGHSYAMFGVFKGLELMDVHSLPTVGDWWGDYCNYLVGAQNANGSWNGYSYWNQWLSTGWYVVILQATVFPVSVTVNVPDYACDVNGYDVNVTYSVERFEVDGTVKIYKDGNLEDTINLDDFKDTVTNTRHEAPDTTGAHTWRAELDVAPSGGGTTVHAEDDDTVNVCETPVVDDIPDQTTPFVPFDLDNYLTTYGGGLPVSWSSSPVPAGWNVEIYPDNTANVTSPPGATTPVTITFTASVSPDGVLVCSGSDTATFTPNRPPVAVCQNITVALDANGQAAITAGDVDGGSYDPDTWDSITLSIDKANFSCSDIGPNTVTLTVTDTIGASDSCQATVIVVDNMAPILQGVPANVTVECDSVPEPATPTATDNCDNDVDIAFTEERADGDCPSSYTLTRTWIAT